MRARPFLIGHSQDETALLDVAVTGKHRCREKSRPLQLTAEDLQTHVHGIGASRSGKSKLIEWTAREWIRNRQGFCLIDPHGHLYYDLLAWLAYTDMDREIILFDPSYEGRVVGFNPFRKGDGDIGVQVDRLIKATVKAWGRYRTRRNPAARAVAPVHLPDRDRRRVLDRYRSIPDLVDQGGDPGPHDRGGFHRSSFGTSGWASRRTSARRTSMNSSKAAGTDYFASSRMTESGGSWAYPRTTSTLATSSENGKILLVNLQPSDVLSEDNARLLGTLLLSEIWDVCMRRRRDQWGRAPSDWFLVIDEFQKFLTPDVPLMLDQAGKYGLHLSCSTSTSGSCGNETRSPTTPS